jgi:post-segregation antitoxin (ccd killing protein)
MDSLKKYRKPDPVSKNRVSTSVSLDRDQARFLKKNNLNLSEFVRDAIEDLKERIRKETEKP